MLSFKGHAGLFALVFSIFCSSSAALAHSQDGNGYWLKIRAKDKAERTLLANEGLSIESVDKDYVIAIGSEENFNDLTKRGLLITGFETTMQMLDFPNEDTLFHNYEELQAGLIDLAKNNPDIVTLDSIGRSVEGREIFHLRITGQVKNSRGASEKPGIVFMGGHHAREHVSIEMPLLLAQFIVAEYRKGTPQMTQLVHGRDIHIIPMVNPDGAEFDVATGRYQMWRKNRTRNRDGSFGVDLNRNYDWGWGTGGSSKNPSSDVFMGTAPFSEPETLAIKNFVDRTQNLTILLSFHTFSELILYPWGGSNDPVPDERDRKTFITMAKTMAQWNGYSAEQSSDMYIATGDTADWAYGAHKIFAFTFELDPASMMQGGFYPGQEYIPRVFNKNIKPCLYLMGLADNPYRVNEPGGFRWGFKSRLFD